jgi:ABC-type sulfate/molybdate transport systems ATPase subunit
MPEPLRRVLIPVPLLQLEHVALRAGARRLVDDLSLALAAGERLVLVGPNGSGKSTLLRALAGLADPAAGRIRRPPTPPGMLFQDGALWPHMSVERHLQFVDTRRDAAWRERLLDVFGLSALRASRPEALSGGERVRLALARALTDRPAWLLLDEPLAHIDAQFGDTLRSALPVLLDELGATTITVAHDVDDVRLFGERVLCLAGDGSWWCGSAREALERPPTAVLAALSGRGTVLTGVADQNGRADLGLGLSIEGHPAGGRVVAFLDAGQVSFVEDGPFEGCYAAPDHRGGCWVRVDGRLLRCGVPHRPLQTGDPVRLAVAGAARVLVTASVPAP